MAMANGEAGLGTGQGRTRGDRAAPDRASGRATGRALDETSPIAVAAKAATPTGILILFMATLILPVSAEIAGIRLSPVRAFLLAAFAPAVVYALSGRMGRWRVPDYIVVTFGLWMIAAIFVNEGASKLPYATVLALELVGGYLLGRLLVRNAADWKRLVKVHLWLIAIMAPFAAVELFTGIQLWAIMLDPIGDVTWRGVSSRPRMGMERVLAGFDHPILFGLFCSIAAANIFYIWRHTVMRALVGVGFVTGMTFASLSSGPLLSILVQAGLVGWNETMKGRWKLLAGLFATVWIFLSLASNRGPIILFIEKMTFSSHNAWMRVNQWEFAWAEVERNPLFGIGLGEWAHPYWMSDSIDAFWLATALRYGLAGLILLVAAFVMMARTSFRAGPLDETAARYRLGWGIGLIGLMFTLTTVHVWDAISVFVMFYLGAGGWYADAAGRVAAATDEGAADGAEDAADADADARPGRPGDTPYSRGLGPRHSRTGDAKTAAAAPAASPAPPAPGPDRPARQRTRSRPFPEPRAETRRVPGYRRP